MRPRRRPFEQTRPAPRDTTRINDAISVPRVRLIDDDGAQLGIKTSDEAREYAYGKNLDLVEVAAQGDPPVAKVMDYGKYKYEQEQKAKQARKHQSQIQVKEIKFRPKIGIGRLQHQEGTRRAIPQPAREGEGHDHVPGRESNPIRNGAATYSSASPRTSRRSGRSSPSRSSTGATW